MNEALATLLEVEVASPPPPRRWVVDALPAFDWQPSVLSVGAMLAARDRALIEQHGRLVSVRTLEDAMRALSDARWDAVIVAPRLHAESDGLRFVRALKLILTADVLSVRIVALRQRYERTPFVVAPLPNDFEFALFRSPSEWFLADQRETPLSIALLRAIGS